MGNCSAKQSGKNRDGNFGLILVSNGFEQLGQAKQSWKACATYNRKESETLGFFLNISTI